MLGSQGFDPMIFNMMLNMMNIIHPNMGYNINNYNINNPQIIINIMRNWINMNPNLLQMYQNFNLNNNNINQNNINNNNNNNNKLNRMNFVKVSESELEKIKVNGGALGNSAANFSLDASDPNDNSPKINIVFITQKQQKANIVASINMKVKDLLLKYVNRLGLGPNVMNDSLFFLYNGSKIDLNEQKTIFEFGLDTGKTIMVLDIKEVIGA